MEYMNADRVFVPEGSEDALAAESTLSDDEKDENPDDSEEDSDEESQKRYAFPELDQRIRDCVNEYGAVFPKLNFSAPKARLYSSSVPLTDTSLSFRLPIQDAAWLLPASAPLKCTSPADVYLLLKSSDFINHDLGTDTVFEGCSFDTNKPPDYQLELVLRKWYPVDRGRELRCFVRDNKLLGLSQRDTNFYEFWNNQQTQRDITAVIKNFWETNIKAHWETQKDYAFDFLLTRDLSHGHILDFNPYSPKTDPLLFTYEELHQFLQKDLCAVLRVVDSRSHPAAASNAPAYQHNMIPFEAVNMTSGRDIEDFADLWKESVKKSMGKDFD
ncbi:unnamed protein product [Cyclocybe aegerita]|uniref:Cell division cycle protein 123 n=1 Tax=Cyclocybe aegerita TaxID=1973307 RepID=A0A8S0VQW0_CYCAE|nr:unnamed protein product [Cyclocybe aegerita]